MNLLRGASSQSINVASLFEIRINSTDRDVIVMRGSEFECAGTLLQGVVVLSVHEPIQARNITLNLRGKARAAWSEHYLTASRNPATRSHREESIVYEKTWSFLSFSTSNKTIGIGNYEYPFEVLLPGDIPESVEGLEYGSIRYKMLATIERPTFAQNLVARKHLRIIRTLSVDSLEMAQTLSVDNTWPNKIEYSISIPTKSYPIGSSIPMNFKLVPLLKGLSIAKITCVLKEYQTLTITHGCHGSSARKEVDRTVASCTIDDLDTDVNNWEIDEILSIPSSLNNCIQDCDVKHIRISHKLKFTVSLLNPDGHISELRAALPVGLLIPPNIFAGGPNFTTLGPTDPSNQLPSYDSHVYDRLYDGIETPLPSGFTTPAQSRSRRGSIEAGHPLDNEQQRRALMAGLQRLTTTASQALPITGMPDRPSSHHNSAPGSGSVTPFSRSHPNSFTPGSFTPAFSEHELTHSLRNSLPSSAAHTPALQPQDANQNPAPFSQGELDNLNRIPSYSTATTSAAAGPLSTSLPIYDGPAATNSSDSTTAVTSTTTTTVQQASEGTVTRPPAARHASHRTGIFRSAHDRMMTRNKDV